MTPVEPQDPKDDATRKLSASQIYAIGAVFCCIVAILVNQPRVTVVVSAVVVIVNQPR